MGTKKKEAMLRYQLYGSLIGSCIVTVGKLAKKSEKDLMFDFLILTHSKEFKKCENTFEVCDYLWDYYKVPEKYKKNVVMLIDEDEIYTPRVTLEVENTILPLDPDGIAISGVFTCKNLHVERIFG